MVVCGFLLVSNKGNNAFVIVAWTAAVSPPEFFCDVCATSSDTGVLRCGTSAWIEAAAYPEIPDNWRNK